MNISPNLPDIFWFERLSKYPLLFNFCLTIESLSEGAQKRWKQSIFKAKQEWPWIAVYENCPTASMSLNWGHRLSFFSFSFVSTSLFVPTYIFAKQQVKLLLRVCMWVLPTVEQSAKCHLSTCALMINTILMVSINFLLHHQKAAVALSLSWPCACFGKPLCGSCWMEIACFSLPHTQNFYRQMYQTCSHTH